jgi:sterol desaturase/sphingolipid hydroxylase (fatty acid hydroxylase superfamily)
MRSAMADPIQEFNLLVELRHIASIVLLGGFVVMIAGEILFPRQADERPLQRLGHGMHNILLGIAGIIVVSVVYGSSILFVIQWLQFHRVGVLYLLPLPIWLHALAAFFLFDACDYVFHRLSHETRWLWLMHAVHHSDPNLDVTSNLRQHPLHIVLTQIWKFAAVAAIGVPTWVFLVHEIVNIGLEHLQHAAIRWPRWIDRAFSWCLITPRQHWNHHSPDLARTNSNYGVIFSIWDRAFGTLTEPSSAEPQFGLSSLATSKWQSTWGMLATPWRARVIARL